MLYDLNLAWTPGTPVTEVERLLRFSAHLGYGTVALNHTITTLSSASLKAPDPLPRFPSPSSSSIPPQSGKPTASKTPSSTSANNHAPKASSSSSTVAALPKVLHRATVHLSAAPSARLEPLEQTYDLVAVRPTTEAAFSWACLSSSSGAPHALVSLDLSARLPFRLRAKTCMAAVKRGVRFEICYSQFLGSGAAAAAAVGGGAADDLGGGLGREVDSYARTNFIANVMALATATAGRGIVVSSEARGVLGLRGPADVANLLVVWGVGTDRVIGAMRETPRGVVVNEGLRRRGWRGVVDVVQAPKPAGGGSAQGALDEDVEMEGEDKAPSKGDQKGVPVVQSKLAVKRKASGGPDGGGVEKLSKTQLKKMRRGAAAAAAAASGSKPSE